MTGYTKTILRRSRASSVLRVLYSLISQKFVRKYLNLFSLFLLKPQAMFKWFLWILTSFYYISEHENKLRSVFFICINHSKQFSKELEFETAQGKSKRKLWRIKLKNNQNTRSTLWEHDCVSATLLYLTLFIISWKIL